jgi:hypothetical protein
MIYNRNTVFVTGQARPGKDDVITHTYEVFSLCLVIDKDTDMIADVSCNAVMPMTGDFVSQLLTGKDLVLELDEMIDAIQTRFFALMQKPLIAALKDAQNRYFLEFPEKKSK